MASFRFYTSRRRLLVATLAAVLVSALLGVWVIQRINTYLVDYVTKQYETQQTMAAQSLSVAIQQQVTDATDKLKLVALQPEVINSANATACNRKLDELLAATEHRFNNLGRVNARGVFVCSGNRQIIGQNASRYGDYIPRLIADPEHKPVVSRLVKGLTGVKGDAIAIHVPVYDGKRFVGTVGGAFYVNDMETKFFSQPLTRNGRLALIDDNGDIIYHSNADIRGKNFLDPTLLDRSSPRSLLEQYTKTISSTSDGTLHYALDGQARTGVYRNFAVGPGRHWSVLVVVPDSDIHAVLAEAKTDQIFLTLIILLTLCIALVTFVTGRNTLRLFRAQQDLTKVNARIEQEVDDRTEQLRQAQAKLNASIDSLPLGYIMSDTKGTIVTINTAAKDILGITTRTVFTLDAIGQALGGARLHELHQRSLKTLHLHEVNGLELGSKIIRVVVSPILIAQTGGQAIGTVMLVEDISERKALERSRDEFFSIASHELRTPLTAIMGNSSMITDMHQKELTPELADMVGDIYKSSVRLIGIVNDFLDVSRLEQGQVSYKPHAFHPAPVISEVIASLQVVAKTKHCDFALTGAMDGMAYADRERVRQILYNLLDNALKATEKGLITINLIKHAKQIEVEITDPGTGIPQNLQHLLFRKFQQAGDSLLTRDTSKGTGLGLYISKLLVEAMGGSIKLMHSEEGKGSTFAFTLPAPTPAQAKAAGPTPQKP